MQLLFSLALFSGLAFAGRPVFRQISQAEILQQSDLVVQGDFLAHKASPICPDSFITFKIKNVVKGDSSLKNKTVMAYEPFYKLLVKVRKFESKGPSYAAVTYKKEFDQTKKNSTIYLKKYNETCYELSAIGAQD